MVKNAKAKFKNADFKSLRFKLTLGFVAFALVLMSLLWVMQTAAFDKFYEKAMAKRAETAVRIVSAAYSNSEKLTVEEFYDQISSLSREGDLYFFIEDTDCLNDIFTAEEWQLPYIKASLAGITYELLLIWITKDQGLSVTVLNSLTSNLLGGKLFAE